MFPLDTYDRNVFLHFCGHDASNGFTSHLYKSLTEKGVKAFKDDNSKGKGEQIPLSHSNAIRKSRIAIVVFSQNYASSKFCLNELVLIYERYKEEKLNVFPVFCYVHPADVRSQKGSYATAFEAFEKYEQGRFKHDKYRTALCELACLHGWHFKQRGEVDEPNLISEITAEVCRVLKTGSLNEKGKKYTTVPENSKALNLTPCVSPQIKVIDKPLCSSSLRVSLHISSDHDGATYDPDVFLNFSGQDTRNGFTTRLYKSLTEKGVKAFKDDNSKGKGEQIPLSHSNAIRKSRIAIVVFSHNYASKIFWNELVLIYERYKEEKLNVFPVFCYVHPADVRSQKGSYATAFAAFEKYEQGRFKHDKYRTALCELACLHGWQFKQRGEVDEPNLISEITAEVWRVLKTGRLNEKGKKYTTVPDNSKALNLTPHMSPQIKVIDKPFCSSSLCAALHISSDHDEATYDHDVFLNFCGQDTRNGFTSHLYKSLTEKGVKAFKDDNGIGKGKPIELSLSNAIRNSRIAIIVFSQNYADSTFCLDELVLIYERYTEEKMTVFPVFYDVDPSVVRHQTASYRTAFEKYEQGRFKHDIPKLHNWRMALFQVACLHGWHFKQTGEVNEPNLISEITAKVCGDLKTWSLNGQGKNNTVPRNSNGKTRHKN